MFSNTMLSSPLRDLFQFPPKSEPETLLPPAAGSTIHGPAFNIPPALYTKALDVRVPITIALLYAVSVSLLNAFNRKNGNKPWAISKTRLFFAFVILHNIFLAVYSAWTFVGMLGAMQRILPGLASTYGFASTIDSLCKAHGRRGLGNAVIYNTTLSQWTSESPLISLGASGTPDPMDYGRFWNEGLAFYGWLFYISKFYEVLDTLIILAKGKRSSTLQTYHHAGAMMCMWSGIRFMSPPIWMFVFLNSAIHTLMYTYYTLTALSIYVPQAVKRSLTTMQIIQFIWGVPYAALHSFISYTIPVNTPLSVKTGVASSTATAVSATATTSVTISQLMKTYLLRALGVPGPITPPAAESSPAVSTYTTVHHQTELQTIPCIDTSGQTLAIWLNVLYLAPLTVLFVRFFIRSYIRRSIGKPMTEKPVDKSTKGRQGAHLNGKIGVKGH